MKRIGYDNDLYIQTQSEHIRKRIAKFGGKLYLEFGGKLYDDNHASRVLPGFQPDSKLRMLLALKEQVEVVIAINADDIEKNKIRGDLGITYDRDVIRLIDIFRDFGLYVSSVVLTRYQDQPVARAFQARLESMGVRVYRHYAIAGYPLILAMSSVTKATARMSSSRPPALWWWSPPLAPAAANWLPAFLRCTTSISAACRPAMPNSRPSPFGIYP